MVSQAKPQKGRSTAQTAAAPPFTAEDEKPLPVKQQRFDDDVLAAITSWEDAAELLKESGIDGFISAEDLGAGFALLKDKRQLVGIPFLVVEWSFHPGAAGQFVSARVVTKDNRKLIVNDGGSGIFDQLRRISDKLSAMGKPFRGVVCKHGLRESEYTYTDDAGDEKPAKTYYLDTSAS